MNHIHKYKKILLGHRYTVFRCMQPGCTHYLHHSLIVGKFSVCWRCSGVFVISGKHKKLTKMHCDNCTKKTKEIDNDSIDDLLVKLGIDSDPTS